MEKIVKENENRQIGATETGINTELFDSFKDSNKFFIQLHPQSQIAGPEVEGSTDPGAHRQPNSSNVKRINLHNAWC